MIDRKEYKREYQKKWYWSHLEQAREYSRKWFKAHYVAHPRKKRVYTDAEISDRKARRNSRHNTDAKREYQRRWYQQHKDYFKNKKREYRQKLRLLMARSPELYAFQREKDRIKHRRIRDKSRKREYHPLLSRRIPNTCVFCKSTIDSNSIFLRNNMDANTIRSCDNYAITLTKEHQDFFRRKGLF